MIDLRLPMGLMFSLLGAILTVFGLIAGDPGSDQSVSSGLRINFYWGLVILAFGLLMLVLAYLGGRRENSHKIVP